MWKIRRVTTYKHNKNCKNFCQNKQNADMIKKRGLCKKNAENAVIA